MVLSLGDVERSGVRISIELTITWCDEGGEGGRGGGGEEGKEGKEGREGRRSVISTTNNSQKLSNFCASLPG